LSEPGFSGLEDYQNDAFSLIKVVLQNNTKWYQRENTLVCIKNIYPQKILKICKSYESWFRQFTIKAT